MRLEQDSDTELAWQPRGHETVSTGVGKGRGCLRAETQLVNQGRARAQVSWAVVYLL